jgi:hypothetical protein
LDHVSGSTGHALIATVDIEYRGQPSTGDKFLLLVIFLYMVRSMLSINAYSYLSSVFGEPS